MMCDVPLMSAAEKEKKKTLPLLSLQKAVAFRENLSLSLFVCSCTYSM